MVALLATVFSASAQLDVIRKDFSKSRNCRTEIILPKVMGYNIYKADFHLHSIYSDGDITPAMRVEEAWADGLDIITISDHMEYRRLEREIFRYMKDYIRPDLRNEPKAVNTNVLNTDPDERGLLVDFNVSYEAAKAKADEIGLMVVRGVEITRGKLGDYNAIFTKNNNTIYDPNLETTIRNAREQGAFIFHNHPQFSKKTQSTMPPHCEDFHAKGLIDGIEVANGFNFYDRLFDFCIEGGYTPFSNSDAHNIIALRYPDAGKEYFRNMTLVLAKNCDEKSILNALKAGRTIAYHANMLVGEEKLLSELFKESVTVEVVGEDSKRWKVRVTNHSSLPYSLRWEKNKEAAVLGNSAATLNVKRGTKVLELEVTNMFYGKEKSPVVSFKIKKP